MVVYSQRGDIWYDWRVLFGSFIRFYVTCFKWGGLLLGRRKDGNCSRASMLITYLIMIDRDNLEAIVVMTCRTSCCVPRGSLKATSNRRHHRGRNYEGWYLTRANPSISPLSRQLDQHVVLLFVFEAQILLHVGREDARENAADTTHEYCPSLWNWVYVRGAWPNGTNPRS